MWPPLCGPPWGHPAGLSPGPVYGGPGGGGPPAPPAPGLNPGPPATASTGPGPRPGAASRVPEGRGRAGTGCGPDRTGTGPARRGAGAGRSRGGARVGGRACRRPYYCVHTAHPYQSKMGARPPPRWGPPVPWPVPWPVPSVLRIRLKSVGVPGIWNHLRIATIPAIAG